MAATTRPSAPRRARRPTPATTPWPLARVWQPPAAPAGDLPAPHGRDTARTAAPTRPLPIASAPRVTRVCVEGTSPGVLLVDVDPPLAPGEVEVTDYDILSAAERAALDDLLRPR